jgi:hypothetical protein
MADLLRGLLARYQQLFKDKKLEIGLIVGIIKDQTGLILTSEEIKLKEGFLYLKTKPKYKLEIILRKDKILSQLNNQGIKVLDLK